MLYLWFVSEMAKGRDDYMGLGKESVKVYAYCQQVSLVD